MNRDFLPYAVPGLLYLSAFLFVAFRMKSIFTPFHCCLAILAAEVAFCLFPLLPEDEFGRTHIEAPSGTSTLILYGSAVTLAGLSILLRRPKGYTLTDFVIVPRAPKSLIIAALLALVLISTLISFKKLGTFPLFVLAKNTDDQAVGYEEVYSGFVTFLAWGAGRMLGFWLLLEVAVHKGNFLTFFRKHGLLAAAACGALLLNALDSQRNPLVLMGLAGLFLLSMKGLLRPIYLFASMAAMVALFGAIGAFRQGEVTMRELTTSTGVPVIDSVAFLVISYIEPNIANLDNLVRLGVKPAFGTVYLSTIVPDSILKLVIDVPDTAVEILTDNKMFSHPGLTFRTAYADFYVDFGALGSVAAVAIVFGLGILLFRHAGTNPYCMLGFLIVSSCVVFIPMMNFAVGIPFIVPFLLFALLSFRKSDGSRGGRSTRFVSKMIVERAMAARKGLP